MSNKFTPKAQSALGLSLKFASEMGHSYVGSEHILWGLASCDGSIAQKLLLGKGVSADKIKDTVAEVSGVGAASVFSPADMSPRAKGIIEGSAAHASQSGHLYIGTEHILMAIVSDRDSMACRVLDTLGISLPAFAGEIETAIKGVSQGTVSPPAAKSKEEKNDKNVLLQFGKDMVEAARRGRTDPVIGRENETERLIQILCRRTKNNPCLIGEPGVGKTAVVEGLAARIAEGDVPDILREKKIISLDLGGMIAGAKYRGEFEERMGRVLSSCSKDPSIIIFIDEIHTIIGAGAAEGAVDAANMIKPALARGELQVIGATTLEEYRRHIEKDAALERRFAPVTVGEPTQKQAVCILRGLRPKYEAHHKLIISDEAIDAAVRLSVRYITDRYLPDKAIDLIDEAAARLRLKLFASPPEHRELERQLRELEAQKEEAIKCQSFELAAATRDKENELRRKYEEQKRKWNSRLESKRLTLSEGDVADVVTQWTKVPVSLMEDDENARLISLEDSLKQRIIGQDTAISSLSAAIRRGRTGLGDPNRPIGSFIFAGDTGVGKTELCIALAEALFGSREALVRLDMSEYMERHSVSKLIGSPPGYVGYDNGSKLCEQVRRSPYSIVLFDEIEKAHPDVFNVLLQILEDGNLTTSSGKKVNFSNTVIILTTNLGSRMHGETAKVGFSSSQGAEKDSSVRRERTLDEIRRTFRPEFLGRIDEIIVFDPLERKELVEISRLLLSSLVDRIESTGVFIELDGGIAEVIADAARIQGNGARDLRRHITKMVENPYAESLLKGEFSVGDLVFARVADGKIIFEKRAAGKGK